MKRLLKRLAFGVALWVPATAASNVAQCGTYAIIQRHLAAAAQGGTSLRVAAGHDSLSGRTLRTPHFAIHYTLGPNVHRPRLTAQDSAGVLRQADSILQTLPPTLTAAQRDQAVNTGLDSIAAPHPVFVQRAAVYFERAYAYYSDSLGMSMPQGGGVDLYFKVDSADFAANAGKYIVDIADLNTLDVVDFGGATYGGTYGPADVFPSGSILLENDFLYDVSLQANGQVTGTPIQAYLNNHLLHDYSRDWDLGIKITASHEFYHAVQYAYTPDPFSSYHAWYELSAVGMEERLVPESDDYYQYLPCIFSHHDAISLLSLEGGCPTLVMYGNATFHQYLTRDFGRKFDVSVWSNLRDNGNNLPAALTAMLSGFGAQWDTVYAAYTAALATASASTTASSCSDTTAPIFTRDLPCWPQPAFDTLPRASEGGSLILTEGALTYRLLKSSAAKAGFVNSTTLHGALAAGSTADYGAVPVSLSGGFELFPTPGNSTLYLDASNPSFTQSGELSVSSQTRGLGSAAIPNPVPLETSVFFPAPAGATVPLTLTLVSESGRRIAELPLNSGFWSWDLRDEKGLPVPPGAYSYRIPGQAVKSLLILAH